MKKRRFNKAYIALTLVIAMLVGCGQQVTANAKSENQITTSKIDHPKIGPVSVTHDPGGTLVISTRHVLASNRVFLSDEVMSGELLILINTEGVTPLGQTVIQDVFAIPGVTRAGVGDYSDRYTLEVKFGDAFSPEEIKSKVLAVFERALATPTTKPTEFWKKLTAAANKERYTRKNLVAASYREAYYRFTPRF
jgi:hypothetical protein